VRLKGGDKNWLLIKHKDEYAISTKYDIEKGTAKTKKKTGKAVKK
jgi:hypothetical protein